ncbi:protein THEM6-like isoform X1 [Agrilus planipennis]|uniref:Protein THEM6 n=1 Tax=Agrilus planipennis TaxID=224129 RepID=A0A1W4XV15_AGRPL|nr:protein THEM6-like [Agrilus planipennis]XP_025830850.1 protein THEM6-like isoform X1 [Agrilus planipennis]
MDPLVIWIIVLTIIIFFQICFDISYFLRTVWVTFIAMCFKKTIDISDETTITGFCFTTDLDQFLHGMNNSKYLREVDFARLDFSIRLGSMRAIAENKGAGAVKKATIVYCRFIKLSTIFKIKTKLLYWDNKSFYLQYKFITKGGLINAFVIQEVKMINCTCESILESISQRIKQTVKKPEPPEFLVKWIEGNSNLQDDKSASITTITTM